MTFGFGILATSFILTTGTNRYHMDTWADGTGTLKVTGFTFDAVDASPAGLRFFGSDPDVTYAGGTIELPPFPLTPWTPY